jgi:hypothetical protein
MEQKSALKRWNIACFAWLGLILAVNAWTFIPGIYSAPWQIVDFVFLFSGISALATLWPGPIPSMLIFFGSFILQWCTIYFIGRLISKQWQRLSNHRRRVLITMLAAYVIGTGCLNYIYVL